MSRKIILIKQELLLLVYELNRSGLLDRKSGSAGMPRPNSYAVFCLQEKIRCSGRGMNRRADRNRPVTEAACLAISSGVLCATNSPPSSISTLSLHDALPIFHDAEVNTFGYF